MLVMECTGAYAACTERAAMIQSETVQGMSAHETSSQCVCMAHFSKRRAPERPYASWFDQADRLQVLTTYLVHSNPVTVMGTEVRAYDLCDVNILRKAVTRTMSCRAQAHMNRTCGVSSSEGTFMYACKKAQAHMKGNMAEHGQKVQCVRGDGDAAVY